MKLKKLPHIPKNKTTNHTIKNKGEKGNSDQKNIYILVIRPELHNSVMFKILDIKKNVSKVLKTI